MAGRPSKRTPHVEQALLEALRAGNTRRSACQHAGISEDALAVWPRRSTDLAAAVERAEAAAETRALATVV